MRLAGKVAIVTWACRGIGLATARRFAEEGAQVVAADIKDAAVEQAGGVGSGQGAIQSVRVDVSRAGQVAELVAATVRRYGRLDVLHSNAAIMRDGSVIDLAEDDWDAMLATNVKGTYLCAKYGIPAMRRSGGGSFIVTASVNSIYAESDIAGYCATKGAVMQLTRAMGIDRGQRGARVDLRQGRRDQRLVLEGLLFRADAGTYPQLPFVARAFRGRCRLFPLVAGAALFMAAHFNRRPTRSGCLRSP